MLSLLKEIIALPCSNCLQQAQSDACFKVFRHHFKILILIRPDLLLKLLYFGLGFFISFSQSFFI